MPVIIREMNLDDYPQVIELWKQTENIGISSADSPSMIANFLQRNPGLSFVAIDDQKIIGAVLGGHDGRRGAIYHLAVQKEYRGNGIGKSLLDHCLLGFKQTGIERCHIHVYADNNKGLKFWQNNGWFLRPELVLLSKDQPINRN
ncbi:MAG TPA: GNAT family N-acetyltransferase [Anaerolineaceae bacterium]|nr:GNAT family N-acetyltransferase [Anaerolineaceae bacterium]